VPRPRPTSDEGAGALTRAVAQARSKAGLHARLYGVLFCTEPACPFNGFYFAAPLAGQTAPRCPQGHASSILVAIYLDRESQGKEDKCVWERKT
jgi:hypothetical protein